MVRMARPTLPRSCSAVASSTKEPMPGRARVLLLTEIISEAVRKNQPPPMLIMQFQSRGIMELGTSSFQKRCQRVRRISLTASSRSAGSLVREL